MRRAILIPLIAALACAATASAAIPAGPTGLSITSTQTTGTVAGLRCGKTYRLGVETVVNGVTSKATWLKTTTAACVTPPPPTGLLTVGSLACGSRGSCMFTPVTGCTITPAAEVHADNTTANHTVGDGSYTWGAEATGPYWASWASTVATQVMGSQTGTTDELFQAYACRWGFSADLFRAVGVQESDWHQSAVGDYCGTVGKGSYGIIQIKNDYCDSTASYDAWGGYPDTQQSTPLALDFYGAYMRTCVDGAFYDGGSWLYNGQTVAQIAAANGWDYVVWGCVGSWFSGGWYDSGAASYIASVKQHLANRDWTVY